MTEDRQKEIEVAIKIARKAGEIMLNYFDSDQHTQIKSDGSPVTIADTEINSLVIDLLAKEFPDDGVIGEEESTTDYGMGRKWFCDPIDGTRAFVWGIPTSMFSLGLVIDGEPQVGVVFDPYLNRMYTSIKGQGSYCNNKLLKVSNTSLDDGIVAISGNVRKIIKGIPFVQNMSSSKATLVILSGAVYKSTLVAKGKYVGYAEEGVGAHDMAAVQLIVEEAGGKVTGLDNERLDYSKPFKGAVISNGVVHDELIDKVNQR